MNETNIKKELVDRLKRIEGQIRGVIRMIEDERNCDEILTQVASLKAALNKIGVLILENHLKICVNKAKNKKKLEDFNEFLEVFSRFIK